MTTLILLVLLAGLFVSASRQASRLDVSQRMERFSHGLDRFLLFVPLLGAAVFAVLFLFVLKGRLYERLCHAELVLALWLYAARFYWMLISFFKHKRILALSIIGMFASAPMAIVLTPLDRYVDLLHSFMGPASVLPGAVLLAFFYAEAFLRLRKNGKRG